MRPAPSGAAEALLVARRPIAPREEITISYIDANQRAGVAERRARAHEAGADHRDHGRVEDDVPPRGRVRRVGGARVDELLDDEEESTPTPGGGRIPSTGYLGERSAVSSS